MNQSASQFSTDDEADFAIFWAAYPRRVAKAEARKAWRQTAAVRPATEVLVAAIRAQAEVMRWDPRDAERARFIPHPASWLRGERWDDEVESPAQRRAAKAVEAEALRDASHAAGDAAMARIRQARAAERGAVQLVPRRAPDDAVAVGDLVDRLKVG